MPTEPPRFSFFDPEYRRNPYPVLARLRAQAPVYKTDYCWVVTRHADVTMLNRDPRCGRDTRKLKSGGFAARMADYPGMVELVTNAMVHLDPPDHTRIRKLIAHAFSPKAVEQMERSVTEVARRLCDELPEQGDFDLMRRLAKPLPVTVICDLMQVPRDDYPLFERWSDAITEHLEVTSSPEQIAAADRAYLEFKAWMAGFVEERRREPGTGLVDRLIAAEAVEGALSSDELLCNIIILLIGGHETTTNLIGNGLLALLEHPNQLALLRARPELIGSAIEECLRYESPLNLNGRCPHEDIEVSGQVIKKGQLIMCMLGAANRDPEVFAEPDRLDITRNPNPHQSFGGGPHFCVGAPLARLEGRIALTALLDRYPTIALDRGRVRWKDRINFRGLAELGLAVSR